MFRIGWVEGIGYLASLLVFCTFYMKTMIPLRCVAVASNVVFMTYGLAARAYPVFVLHAVLLPLNLVRLRQMRTLIRRVQEASRGDPSMEWLIPLMTRRKLEAGHVLFRKGDPASSLYVILGGSLRLTELGVVRAISDQKVLQLFYQNPAFGFYLFRLVLERVVENMRGAKVAGQNCSDDSN